MRRTALRSRNNKSANRLHARNFGEEAKTVRMMPCCVGPDGCSGPVEVAHVVARGRGGCKGGRFDVAPLCRKHHREAGEQSRPHVPGEPETQRHRFERVHRIKLRAVADRIAIEHSEPLGLVAVARRYASTGVATEYEKDAIAGWMRRNGALLTGSAEVMQGEAMA